ncbi:MAG: homoserine dehydrogenase [Planctomycetota bacterium]
MTTLVASFAPASGARARAAPPRVLHLGLLGLGVVGQGLVQLLRERAAPLCERHGIEIQVTHALVRDRDKQRQHRPDGCQLLTDASDFLAHEYDLVVEALGGVAPTYDLVAALLSRGTPVVSGNKTLLAARGLDLAAIAAAARTVLAYEASVAAGIPILRLLETSLQSTRVKSVAAILNGTSNFVITRITEGGCSLEGALDQAVRQGFAESDPALDLDGHDAAQKLCVLWRDLHGSELREADVVIESIRDVTAEDGRTAAQLQLRLKPIALAAGDASQATALVAPAVVHATHPLANVRDEQNGILLRGDIIPELFLAGPGAGAAPTAAAILDDILAIHSGLVTNRAGRPLRERATMVARSWPRFVRLELAGGRDGVDDVLAIAARHGTTLVRLRECAERDGLTLAGLTAPLADRQCQSLAAELRTLRGCRCVRAYRLVD